MLPLKQFWYSKRAKEMNVEVFTSEITIRTFPFTFLMFPWKPSFHWTPKGPRNHSSGMWKWFLIAFYCLGISFPCVWKATPQKPNQGLGKCASIFVPSLDLTCFSFPPGVCSLQCTTKEHLPVPSLFLRLTLKKGNPEHWCYSKREEERDLNQQILHSAV